MKIPVGRIAFYFICSTLGAFNNYVDIILPLFAPCVDSFYTLRVDKRAFIISIVLWANHSGMD